MPALIIIAILAVGYFLYRRSQELFCIAVRGGKLTIVRGRAPGALLSDLEDALDDVDSATIRAYKTANGARISCSGSIDDRTAQRVRNIFGLYPISQLRAPRVDGRQAMNDAFTISWLISMLRSLFR